jgi:RNA polymerase sigma factor (sigma-70 family)
MAELPPAPAPYVPGSTTNWNNSWREIYEQFGPAILAYARRGGLNAHSAEDVLQEVMTTVIRCQHQLAAGYIPRLGSFQAWFWGVIRNRVRSVRREDQKQTPATEAAAPGSEPHRLEPRNEPAASDEVASAEEAQWQHSLLAAAMRRMQQRVTARNFTIYQALLQEKSTARELALHYKLEPNAIYAIKHRCEETLLSEARALLQAWERLGPAYI